MFSRHLRLEATLPGRWVLVAPLIWLQGTEHIRVPQGFVTDLASIPRLLRPWLDQNGISRKPAVMHDYLYRTQIMPRAAADALFRRALKAECGLFARRGWRGVLDRAKCFAARWVYWAGVRLGGWIAWKARRADATQ